MSEYQIYEGNCPRNVSRDARYSIRTGRGEYAGKSVVTLTYEADEDERWYMSTDEHPDLVKMVTDVKRSVSSSPHGSFYINEYHQVIVPSAAVHYYFLAGTYESALRFDFDGKSISGDPTNLAGEPLSPGDIWDGPHAGVPYVISPQGPDIYYTTERVVTGGVIEQKKRLTKCINPDTARDIARQFLQVKGYQGGRIYVNEFKAVFTPITDVEEVRYVYIGQIDLEYWFPMPHTQES